MYFLFNVYMLRNLKGASIQQKIFFSILLFLYVLLFIIGLLKSNYLPYMYLDLINFSSFSLILIARPLENFKIQMNHFVNSFERYSILVLILAIAVFLIQDISPAQSEDTRFIDDETVGLYSSPEIVYYALFFSLFFSFFKNLKYRLSVLLSVVLMLVYSIFTLSRGLFLAGVFSIIYIFISYKKKTFSFIDVLILIAKVFIVCFIIYLILVCLFGFDKINLLINLFYGRFFEAEDFSSGRNEEESLLWADLTFTEKILGRGFGGANNTWIWSNLPNGINLVHKWYMHLLLKGGMIYVSIFCLINLFAVVKILSNERYILFPFFILFYLLSFGHTQFYGFTSMSIFWILFGFTLTKLNNYHESSSY